MDTPAYVCTGHCGAVINQKQFDDGLQACGADGCDHKGIPFEKRVKCTRCGELYHEGEEHICA